MNDNQGTKQGQGAECELQLRTENLCVNYQWELMPTDSAVGSMIVTFSGPDAPAVLITPQNEPFLELWMPSMGHGSSPVSVEFIETGKFRFNDVFFIMPGPWDMRFQLLDNATVADQVIEKIDIP